MRECACVNVNVSVCVKTSGLLVGLKREWKCKWGCEHACTSSVHKCGCPHAWFAYVHVQQCVRAHGPPPLPFSPCLVGSAGNVTPVPGIAASLDPGNSDDRNRHLLPLRRTHCLATGSPHTRPKPFSKGVFFVHCPHCSPPSLMLLWFLLCLFPPPVLFVLFGNSDPLCSVSPSSSSPAALSMRNGTWRFSAVTPAPLQQAVSPSLSLAQTSHHCQPPVLPASFHKCHSIQHFAQCCYVDNTLYPFFLFLKVIKRSILMHQCDN